MGVVPQEAIDQFEVLMQEVDEPLKRTFKNIHQGYPQEALMRFLKAREGNVTKAYDMLVDCLKWRVENNIDEILNKPIVSPELYREIRDSQLIGLSGYTNEGLPVFAVGVGLSSLNRASVHYYVQSHIQINEYRDRVILPAATKKYRRHVSKCIKVLDMTGLKLSALNQIKLITIICSVDDLNYPEKTQTYYIVNSPYVFSACWKVVKPLLQERTRRKVDVLSGCGQDELLKILDYSALPHFCRKRDSAASNHLDDFADNCFSWDHPFHQQLYNYVNEQSLKQGSVIVTLSEEAKEGSEFDHFKSLEKSPESFNDLKISDDK